MKLTNDMDLFYYPNISQYFVHVHNVDVIAQFVVLFHWLLFCHDRH